MISRDAAGALVDRAYGLIFSAIGHAAITLRPTPVTTGEHRVLVLAPHPDDEVAGCGGALLQHTRAGDEARAVIVCDGRGSRALDVSPEEMARLRATETQNAAEILGARLDALALPELEWTLEAFESRLKSIVDDFAPTLIYAPSRIDGHPEHFRVAHVLARVLSTTHVVSRATVRAYQVQIPLTPVLTNFVADVSNVAIDLQRAFAAYASQRGSLDRLLRLRRQTARLYGARELAEPYWELSAETYARLHADPDPDHWSDGENWFGARARAFRDPVAYLKGLRARARLRAKAARSEAR